MMNQETSNKTKTTNTESINNSSSEYQKELSDSSVVPDEETRKAHKRKEFEIKMNVIITEMRKSGIQETEILDYIESLKANFEQELSYTPEELAQVKKQHHEETLLKNQKAEFQHILEIYFQHYIDYDSQYQSPEELASLKQKYEALINRMADMNPDELDDVYNKINEARRIFYERYNQNTIFKECLEKEVSLKLKKGIITVDQVPSFRATRIKKYLSGEFDYPDILKDNVIKEASADIEHPLTLIDIATLPDIRIELAKIKADLENQNIQETPKKL